MLRLLLTMGLLLLNFADTARLPADEPAPSRDTGQSPSDLPVEPEVSVEPDVSVAADVSAAAVRAALQKALPLLEHGAKVSAAERTCFTCHNQAVPVLALTALAARGFATDRDNRQLQLQHTWNHLDRGRASYQQGKGQGGQVLTAGYALWTLEAGSWKSDETTAAVTHYLAEYQKDQPHWSASSQRLPSAGSPFTATYVALRALSYYGTAEQAPQINARRTAAAKWLLETEPRDTEDRVFRLLTLPYIAADEATRKAAVEQLLTRQNTDGGWSQTESMASDAYASGTVLTALQEVGQLPSDHPAIVSGCRYLLKSQLDDGSWHVVTHARPIQEYYESGFPHGEDQFISIAATGWATLALAHTLPPAADQ